MMNPKKVALVQINSSFANQSYLPYSVGRLQAYTERYADNPGRFEFYIPFFKRVPVEQAARLLRPADIAAFSTYIWNIRLSLVIAQRIKEEDPDKLVIFGGPQVPDRAEQFLKDNPFIDIVCHGEGEDVFTKILENSAERNWKDVPGVSYVEEGKFIHHPKAGRIRELTAIPSPYLDGTFAKLIKDHPHEKWIASWETNRGCPFSCTFCDWGSATQAKVYTFDMGTIDREIDWFAEQKISYVVCCDANFGILPRDLEIAQRLAETKKKFHYPVTVSIQSTKNATDRSYQVQKIIADAGMNNGVTMAMQSLDQSTLKSIKRQNISLDSYNEIQKRFTQDNVETYTDLILGLPGETYDSFFDGVSQVIANGQHNRIQFSNCAVLPNAEMGDPEYQKRFAMELVEVRTVNIHGTLVETADDIPETQDLVIATNTMPRRDWCKTRVLAWMVALLHFDKLFQIPLILLHELCDLSFRELFEVFMERDLSRYPVLREIRDFLWKKAEHIQNGGEEYCNSPEWLNIWWPTDEYVLIKLSVEKKLDAFYEEAEAIFGEFLRERFLEVGDVLHEAILLNKSLLNQPFLSENIELELSYNIWEVYQMAKRGTKIPLEKQTTHYQIDRSSSSWNSWEDWFREVVWYGSKRGAYFNKNIVSAVA